MSTDKFEPKNRKPKAVKFLTKRVDSIRSIMRSTSILSVVPLTSRVLGFFRDIILAKIFGTTFRADAFFVALKIPNLFRDLVGEGATNAAVVPVMSEYKESKKPEEFWELGAVGGSWCGPEPTATVVDGVVLLPATALNIGIGRRTLPHAFKRGGYNVQPVLIDYYFITSICRLAVNVVVEKEKTRA